MDLVCDGQNQSKIVSFGTSLMLGIMIGSIALTNIADIYGRKPVLVYSTIASSILTIPLILSISQFYPTVILTFAFGVTVSPRYSVAYMYSVELSTQSNATFFGVLCLVGDSISSIFIGIYFYYIKSQNPSLWFMALV